MGEDRMRLIPTKEVTEEWWQLYSAAFPAEERRNATEHEHALRDDAFHACMLRDVSNFVGLLTWWQWDNMLYVEHLAIAQEKRGMGYGGAALQALKQCGLDIVLEIEPVRDDVSAKRLAFYQANGFVLLPFPHTQLAYQKGYPDIELLLLGYSPAGVPFHTEKWAEFEKRFANGPMRYRDAE